MAGPQSADYSRPADGFRFKFDGVHITTAADDCPQDKYPYAQNVRGYREDSTRTRPPLAQQYNPAAGPVVSLEPTLNIRKAGDTLYNGNTNLGGGYDTLQGCSLIPYRPNQSPQTWEYVFDRVQSNKVLPSQFGSTVQKIGIAEPQSPVDAAPLGGSLAWTGPHPAYVQGGTAGVPAAGNRGTDAVVAQFHDGLGPGQGLLTTLQVGGTVQYTKGQLIQLQTAVPGTAKILDVFPLTPATSPIGIQGVFYYSGIIGRAVIVPNNISSGPGQDESIYAVNLVNSLRRGALVKFSGNGEVCMITAVVEGPTGSISFEVVTTTPHSNTETLTFVPGIQISDPGTIPVGTVLNQNTVFYSQTVGFGWQSTTLALNYFTNALQAFQPSDQFHFSLKIDNLANFVEGKWLIDVGNGDFISNVFVWSFRVNDIQASLPDFTGGTGGYQQTQLGIAQLVLQRQLIDEQNPKELNNQGNTASSSQVVPGNNQWAEMSIPLSQFTRVGSDDTKTLQNITGIRLLLNVSGSIVVEFVTPDVFGGFSPDVTATGVPYLYRIRPRSSLTGAKGNPSPEMRYGVNPRRQSVEVILPTTYSDPQVDTWDIFRMGGSIDQYVLIGSVPLASLGPNSFTDNYSDLEIANNQVLEEDDYEPFPTIVPPLSGSNASATGHVITTTLTGAPSPFDPQRLLPGNIIQINQQDFTLVARPIFFGGTLVAPVWLLQLAENAGVMQGPVNIQEPLLANQLLNTVWGPDVNGVLFAVADVNRPGFVYYTKPFNPDASSDNATELSPPSEPLIGGCLTDGTSIVFSTKRAWRAFPGQDADGNLSYNWIEIPVAEGAVVGIQAIASDGQDTYYIARDGIRKLGERFPVTNEDLYNLFPHEGILAVDYTYANNTIFAPNYMYKDQFRLAIVNKFLFFDYRDTGNVPHTLVCNLYTGAWVPDTYSISPATIHAGETANIFTAGFSSATPQLWIGGMDGALYTEQAETALVAGQGEQVSVVVATREEVAGDIRAYKQFGDADINLWSRTTVAGGIQVTPFSLQVAVPGVAPTVVPGAQPARASFNVGLSGEQLLYSLGLVFAWTEQGTISILYSWQPSYIPKPETIFTRVTDWDDSGSRSNKFYQGFVIEADTFNALKNVVVRDQDTLTAQQTFPLTLNGQMEKAFSFTTPFQAHAVRLEPATDGTAGVKMRLFGIRWIAQPTPENVQNWITQPTGHGFNGYQHIRQILLTYKASAPVSLAVMIDGVAAFSISFPATGGNYLKTTMAFPSNKGLVYQYSLTSGADFQVWNDDIELDVKPWGSTDDYSRVKILGSEMGNLAPV